MVPYRKYNDQEVIINILSEALATPRKIANDTTADATPRLKTTDLYRENTKRIYPDLH